jgi:hypothetical protein
MSDFYSFILPLRAEAYLDSAVMTPPRKILRCALDFSTLPQGEGEEEYGDDLTLPLREGQIAKQFGEGPSLRAIPLPKIHFAALMNFDPPSRGGLES